MAPATKLRPYRVDYFDVPEMQGDKALVRSILVRCPTAKQAKEFVGAEGRFIIKAYRFYKRLSAQPKKKVFLPIEKLFPGAKAVDVMEQVEAYRAKVAAPAADPVSDHVAPDPAYGVTNATFYKSNSGTQIVPVVTRTDYIDHKDPEPTTGPDSPATKAVVEDLNGMMAHDEHEQVFDTFVPQIATGVTTPQIQSVKETTDPVTVRTTDGTLGILDPTATNKFGQPINDLGLTPAAQADMDAVAEQHDRVIDMMKADMGIDETCPTCHIGKDTNNDGDCLVCTSPAYTQAHDDDRTLSQMEYSKPADYNPPPMPACEEVSLARALGWIGFTLAIIAGVAAYLYFCHH